MKPRRGRYNCSFCGKSQEAVRRLIAGPGVSICSECISLCNQIIAEEGHRSPTAQGAQPGSTGRGRTVSWWQRLQRTLGRKFMQTSNR